MSKQKSTDKPFNIPKQAVWDAWLKVKGNQGQDNRTLKPVAYLPDV